MKDIFNSLAEARIREAIEKGQLKNLPGEGKPVHIPDMPFVPDDEKMAMIIMKNSGLIPDEMAIKKEMEDLKNKISETNDEKEVEFLKKKHGETSIRYNILMEKRRTRR